MPSILPIPIMVIWSPASDMRPHKVHDGAKGDKKYFVRIGSETVDANKNGVLQQLLQITAKVPFDDRRANHAMLEDLREGKVREFLRDIESGLLEDGDLGFDADRSYFRVTFPAHPEYALKCT